MTKLLSIVLVLTISMSVVGLPTFQDPKPETVAATPPAADMVTVPDGTEIEIQLKTNASGEELKIGDIVDFVVVKPVQVNGVTIFEKEAAARARITTAKRAGHWGHAGCYGCRRQPDSCEIYETRGWRQ